MITYEHVRSYKRLQQQPNSIQNQLAHYRGLDHIFDAIEDACDKGRYTDVQGNKHLSTHFYRLSNQTLEQVEFELFRKIDTILSVTNFDELYSIVSDAVDNHFQNATLTKYEIAIRLGAFLRVEPTDKVYVCRGALVGIQRLAMNTNDVFVFKSDIVSTCPSLDILTCIEIEDILCLWATAKLESGCQKAVSC